MRDEAPALAPLELASGLILGEVAAPPAMGGAREPLEAFAAAVRPALQRPPCLVAFSGGRDSSAVLAGALDVARREGLPEPIPCTLRFTDAPMSEESAWQELVVDHLGLADWVRIELADELDVLGPFARRILERYGVLWPFNIHTQLPVMDAAVEGSVLTGLGGDELFEPSRWARADAVLSGTARPRVRDGRQVAVALAPRTMRRGALMVREREVPSHFTWLRRAALLRLAWAWADEDAAAPRGWAARGTYLAGRRMLRQAVANLGLLGREAGVLCVQPLLDRGFTEAVSRRAALRRPSTRRDAMAMVFGDLLPERALARGSKAAFDEAFWRDEARSFARDWDGAAADPAVVDHDALRTEWSRPRPSVHTCLLLQAAWQRAVRPDTPLTGRAAACPRLQES